MEIIRDLDRIGDYPNPVVTIGNFDGVHRGHQKIFSRVVTEAERIGGTPIAITFEPHPVRVLYPERGQKLITTYRDKMGLISLMGIKVLICIPFSREFARTEPDDFIRNVLVDRLHVRWVIVGHSYAFGRGKKGSTALLRRRGGKYGFKVSVVRYAKTDSTIVSSSRVRSLLLRGRVCEASRMLGRLYHVGGVVVHGAGRGAKILHTPTANISMENELIPKEGVYAVRVSLPGNDGRERTLMRGSVAGGVFDGVMNIGCNPTFGDGPVTCEVHIFDADSDFVGRELRVHFVDRIRDEKKFPGAAELMDQIAADIGDARTIHSRRDDVLYL